MTVSEYFATFDVIHADDLMAHFALAAQTCPFVLDMLAVNGYTQRPDGLWRRAKRITLSNLTMSPAGSGGVRTGRGGVPVEYRHRRNNQPQGQRDSIWSERHAAMMRQS